MIIVETSKHAVYVGCAQVSIASQSPKGFEAHVYAPKDCITQNASVIDDHTVIKVRPCLPASTSRIRVK